jgi:large subunit ribosomal protein L13e|tara:strand:+ start:184 stop:771 length:588 start_codon:yes stop_codon:yes gene_type:complete
LRKHWITQKVKCFFNVNGHKTVRSQKRADRAAARSPAPLDLLRPTVKACTRRYASKIRFGRGFSLEEIRAAGLTPAFARTVGIAVDHRRHGSNQMEEANIQRLTTYKANLVLFPRVEGKAKKGEIADSTTRLDTPQNVQGGVLALPPVKARVGLAALTKDLKSKKVYRSIREARVNRKYEGKRIKRAKEAEEKKK